VSPGGRHRPPYDLGTDLGTAGDLGLPCQSGTNPV
jgi:hypothetical protein